jgi:hypothetical protein
VTDRFSARPTPILNVQNPYFTVGIFAVATESKLVCGWSLLLTALASFHVIPYYMLSRVINACMHALHELAGGVGFQPDCQMYHRRVD